MPSQGSIIRKISNAFDKGGITMDENTMEKMKKLLEEKKQKNTQQQKERPANQQGGDHQAHKTTKKGRSLTK